MPVTSKRVLAIQDLQARLSFIKASNGFSSNAGETIFLGKLPKIGPSDPPSALGIFLDEDQPDETGVYTKGGMVRCKVPIWIYAVARMADKDQPLLVYEGLIADIKQAVEIEGNDPAHPEGHAWRDRYLGVIAGAPPSPATLSRGFERGQTQVHFAEGGSTIIGASIQYLMFLEEKWGQP